MEKVIKYQILDVKGDEKYFDTPEEAIKKEKEVNFYKKIDTKVRENIGYSEYQQNAIDFIWDNAEWLYEVLKQRFE